MILGIDFLTPTTLFTPILTQETQLTTQIYHPKVKTDMGKFTVPCLNFFGNCTLYTKTTAKTKPIQETLRNPFNTFNTSQVRYAVSVNLL